MKRIIALFLSMLMILSLSSSVLAADIEETEISFALTVDGKNTVYVSGGEEIIVELVLKNKTEDAAFEVESIWNDIDIDNDFFEIDETQIESSIIKNYRFQADSNKKIWARFNGEHIPIRAYGNGEAVGSFKLKVAASSGQSTVSSTRLSLYGDDYRSYKLSADDLTVIVGDETSELYTVDYISCNENVGTSQKAPGIITVGAAPNNGPDNSEFKGWEYKGALYQPGDSFELTDNVTFTAKWEGEISNYSLIFNTNGGTTIDKLTAQEGTTVVLADYQTTRTGYVFDGWYLDAKLTSKIDSITLDGNKTVYAKWIDAEKPVYILTFNTNGGSSVNSLSKEEGSVVDLSAYASTKAGFIFEGWYQDAELNQKVNSVTLNGNKTVYAKWRESTGVTFTLSFNSNGGSSIASVTTDEGTSISLSSYKPTKSGYSFAGWYLDEQLTKNATIITLNSDVTVYAKWTTKSNDSSGGSSGGGSSTSEKEFTITFKNVDDTLFKEFRATSDTKVNLEGMDIKKDGYELEGFYTDKEMKNKVTTINLTKDTTLYINWTKVDTAPGSKPAKHPANLTTEHYAYIVGREGGRIEPMANITRAEVATIFFRLLTEEVRKENITEENNFADVNAGDWFNTPVSTLAAMGIIKGRTETTFEPGANITRAEFTAIAARFSDASYSGEDLFSDIKGHWAKDYINQAASLGWVVGDNGIFRPNDNITRAEVMTLVNRVLNRVPENESDLLGEMTKWEDNSDKNAWYYLAVQEATNSHNYEMKPDGIHEKWTTLTESPDW